MHSHLQVAALKLYPVRQVRTRGQPQVQVPRNRTWGAVQVGGLLHAHLQVLGSWLNPASQVTAGQEQVQAVWSAIWPGGHRRFLGQTQEQSVLLGYLGATQAAEAGQTHSHRSGLTTLGAAQVAGVLHWQSQMSWLQDWLARHLSTCGQMHEQFFGEIK